MDDYESGYDPKYGYNRNAFAHKALLPSLIGKVVRLIVTPIGLVSEGIHHHNDKRRASQMTDVKETATASTEMSSEKAILPHNNKDSTEEAAYVNLPVNEADHLIATGQALPTDRETATHELVREGNGTDGIEGDEGDEIEGDEEDWALDDAALEIEGPEPSSEENIEKSTETLIQDIRTTNGKVTPSKLAPAKLSFPVILPQRRPGTKARGFVRSYSPVLEESGIDQEMFLRFLKSFHAAAQVSPIFKVVMIATGIAGAYPDPIVGLAVQAVQTAAGIGQEIQERYRLNKFLNQANKEIFIPKGLFALIVTYKHGSSDQPDIGTETIDLGATAMAKYGGALLESEKTADEDKTNSVDKMKETMKNLRIASGETRGEAEMPVTCAPLVFPQLDAIADAGTSKSAGNDNLISDLKAKSTSVSKFVSDYYDRRAQAHYSYNNPNSTLTTQVAPIAPQFKSRFADPNDGTNMHFFTLITGGLYKAEPLGGKRRYLKAQRKAAEKRAQGIRETPKKRMLSENVLYLMVVNMPTELELEKAKKELQDAAERKAAAKRPT